MIIIPKIDKIQNYISIKDCVHGGFYKIKGRNFGYGIYDSEDDSFRGLRIKFHDEFIDKEFHYDIGSPHGTVKPIKFIKMCPLPLIENDNLYNWINEEINKIYN